MNSNVLKLSPTSTNEGRENSNESKELVQRTSFSVRDIIDKYGRINFEALICFLEKDDAMVVDFFKQEGSREKILFPFFDYIKFTYFSENQPAPQNIVNILEDTPVIRDAIIAYIDSKNSSIISSQHIEQYDTVAFHLFLLGMDQDFDLVKDIQIDHFRHINALFADAASRVSQVIGIMKTWTRKDSPEALTRELEYCIQIGETINKLALIHAVNFEERQVSFELGVIIRNNIELLLRQLDQNFIENNIIGKKLRYLSGKVQCNFAHGVMIDGETLRQIEDQINRIKKEQHAGFELQKESGFGGDTSEEESSSIVLMGNETITDLIGIERMESIQRNISPELKDKKTVLLHNLVRIYNYGVGREFIDIEALIDDFIVNGIKNEYQIEVIYYIILFDRDIKSASLEKIATFFLSNKKQINNFFYEEFVIKITAQIVRRFHTSGERLRFLPLVDRIYASLKDRNISHSILSYSKVYLSLALYYVECGRKEYVEYAKVCFLHYRNLSTSFSAFDKNLKAIQDEKEFLTTLGGVDEVERYRRQAHHDESLEMSGGFIFERATERHQQSAILSIEAEVGKIIASMNAQDDVYSQDQINNLLGKKIAETIFYNLCTISVVGDCRNCRKNRDNKECGTCNDAAADFKAEHCPLIVSKRGFQRKHIALAGGIFIVFVYPSVSEKIFDKIFFQQKTLMKERFGNLIAINNKNTRLQASKLELEKLAFYDAETDLPNENKLNKDLKMAEKTVVLIEIAGYDSMIATQGGKEDWIGIIRKVAKYLEFRTETTIYRYNKSTLCLAYGSEELAQRAERLGEDPADTANVIRTMIEVILANFYLEYGKNMQFHVGIVINKRENHTTYAHIALIKAKETRKESIYIFEDGDEQAPEDARNDTDILIAALDLSNPDVRIVPHYQPIFDPKNQGIRKFEALARIERTKEDGTIEIIGPHKFIDIATRKRWLSEISLIMLRQILADLNEYPDTHVSINLHEQDWHNDGIISNLRNINREKIVDIHRVSLEILETVPFDSKEDRDKIQELKGLGYKISIDDYGENNSNLKKIMLIRPDNIKIDRIIIESLYGEDTRKDAIAAIQSVIAHARNIGASVTAEYIESEEIFLILQKLGVDFFQGYHFGKPKPIAENMKQE